MNRESALIVRSQVIRSIRRFFEERGFLEVETPLLIPANAPEEYIDPIIAQGGYLQTSPEICMKRLLCRGHKRLFQISRCWRAAERGVRHLSEFTMLEWYRADADYKDLMDDCKGLLRQVASDCLSGDQKFRYQGVQIDPFGAWRSMTLSEAFSRFAKVDVYDCIKKDLYEEILSSNVEPALARFEVPVILRDFPMEMAALSRRIPENEELSERFELYLGGLELANGFSELNRSAEQRDRFEEANKKRSSLGKSGLPMPEPFLAELDRMPDSAGIALGVDRLVMLVTGLSTIDGVVAFTPEEL